MKITHPSLNRLSARISTTLKSTTAFAVVLAVFCGPEAGAATLTWTGGAGASSNVWDIGVTTNWLSGGVPAVFNNGDAVVFDDTGTNIPTVRLTTTVMPASVTVNSAAIYALTNSGGSLGGNASITKLGTGGLFLRGANSYSGGTTNTAGYIEVFDANSLGTGTLTLDTSGTISKGLWIGASVVAGNGGRGITNSIFIKTASAGNMLSAAGLLSGRISGPGNWSWNGFSSGSLTLGGDSPEWTGGFRFTGAAVHVLYLGHTNALGSGALIMATGVGNLPVVGAVADLSVGSGVANAIVMSADLFTFNLTNNLLLSGPISGGSNFVKSGSATLILSGSNTFTGNLTNAAGTLKLGNSAALGSGTLVISGGKLGTATAVALTNKIVLATDGEVANTNDLTLSGVISGSAALTKSGSGTLTLSGANAYSGGTTISNGILNAGNLTGSGTGSGPVAVESGSELAGSGTIMGSVTVASGGSIAPGADGVGTLTLNSQLYLNDGSSVEFEITNTDNADKIVVGGNLSPSGVTTINLANPTPLPAGDYTLLEVGGTLGGSAANFSVASPSPGKLYTIVYRSGTPNKVGLSVADIRNASLVWRGGLAGNAWDMMTTSNWLNGAYGDVFLNADGVTFDATGSTNPTVNIAGAVFPAAVTVNSASEYTFAGAGKISGTGGLTTSGTGTLTVLTDNDYTGTNFIGAPVTMGNGGTSGSLGSGDIQFTTTNKLTFNRSDAVTVSNAIAGGLTAKPLLVVNAGTLTLAGTNDNAWLRALVKSNATLVLAKTSATNVHAVGGGGLTIEPGGIVILGGTGGDQIADNNNNGSITNDGILDMHGLSEGIGGLNGDGVVDSTVFGATVATLTMGNGNMSGVFDGVIKNTGATGNKNLALTKLGTATQVLSGSNTYSGGTTLSAGTLMVGNGSALGTGVLTMNGGTLGTAAAITLANNLVMAANSVVANTNDLTLSGVISGSATLTKSNWATLTLSGTNTLTGRVIVKGSTLCVNGSGATLSSASSITVTNDAQLAFMQTMTNASPITLTASGSWSTIGRGGMGALVTLGNGGVQVTHEGNITLAPATPGNIVCIGGYASTHTTVLNGVISGTGPLSLRAGGANNNHWGKFLLNNRSIYTGNTRLDVGQANNFTKLGIDGALPATTVLTLFGAVVGGILTNYSQLVLDGHNQTLAGIVSSLSTVAAITNRITGGNAALSTLTISNTVDDSFDGVLGGGNATDNNLALVKAGIGELTLTRANTYSGGTTISNGFLNVGNTSGSGTGSGFVSVKSGGSLSGTGIITGAVIVNNGGALSPGDMGIGQLRISNALTLAAGSTTAMEINKSTSTSDAVVGLTSVSYNGTLTVTNLGGTLAAGDSFKLFNATSYNGSFDAIVPAAPGAWLAWDTNTLAIDGTLRVLAVCEVTFVSQPVGRAAVVGGTVSFSATAHTTTGVTNYQWQFAGLPIPGATNKLLVVNSVQATNFGAYAVVVGNGLCSSPSKTVQLTQAVRPSFLPSRLNGTTISMSFPTELGPVYVVEYNGTVDDATWQVLNTLNGTGNNELVTDTIANALTRFYRIRMQ